MSKPNILIVDDRVENLVALHAVLDSPNYDLIDCTSGMDALRRVLTENVDLILMDVQMPEMDGFQTAEMIHTKPKCDAIPVIFITAIYTDEESKLKGYQSGGFDYITKPFHPDALKKKVEFFLNYSKKIREQQKEQDLESDYMKFMSTFNEMINPLWAILLNVQLLKKYSTKDKNKLIELLEDRLSKMEASTKKLKDLILNYQNQLSPSQEQLRN